MIVHCSNSDANTMNYASFSPRMNHSIHCIIAIVQLGTPFCTQLALAANHHRQNYEIITHDRVGSESKCRNNQKDKSPCAIVFRCLRTTDHAYCGVQCTVRYCSWPVVRTE